MPAAVGFITAVLGRIPQSGLVLLITSPRGLAGYGRLHGHGMNLLGLDPARVILVEAPDEKRALWAIEEALRSAVPAAVVGAIGRGLDLKTSQRLQLATRTSGLPLLLLRPAGETEANAAVTRWAIATAEAPRDRFGLIAGWRWRVRLERCRNGRPGEWLVEWDNVTHRFSLAPALANPTLPQSTIFQPLRRAG
jgi:protein ImuA